VPRKIFFTETILATLAIAMLAISFIGIDKSVRGKNSPALETKVLTKKADASISPNITASSSLAIYIGDRGATTLFGFNAETQYPIASITKLMTALVALKNYDGRMLVANAGIKNVDQISVDDLLYFLLIESNNNAANALSKIISREKFIELMNDEAKSLNLEKTIFLNPSGLDKDGINLSSGEDLAKLAEHILLNYPYIFEITRFSQFVLDINGKKITLNSTDDLLKEEGLAKNLIGGKTGETRLAGETLLTVFRAPDNSGYIIIVILKSADRFDDTIKILDAVTEAYQW